ncbi:MAG TPA: tRNA 2-selenouridine(34) synthase MnmH [Bacteroidia bacterium]|nr:tRNA 2-selenouridine(34) synthase MnmH [Bacteroidia bacterium]
MAEVLLIEDFLERLNAGNTLLLDVRSESEFYYGRIPGAVNLPLLNDEERKEVGITYKKQGHNEAVEKGFELVGGKFVDFIREVKALLSSLPSAFRPLSSDNQPETVFIYCWRGGMRSSIMSWVLETTGIKTALLQGGYKSYRNWALQQFEVERPLIVLGGKTGSGKTFLLNELAKRGEQVLDFEALANHRGSAFGAIGMGPQPRQEHFENLIAYHLSKTNPDVALWVENESRKVGSLQIPNPLFDRMVNSPLMEVVIPDEERVQRISDEYGKFPLEDLRANTIKLERSLGGARLKEALQLLDKNNLEEWIKMMLSYYDKTYHYGLSLRNPELNFPVEVSYSNINPSLEKIIQQKNYFKEISI